MLAAVFCRYANKNKMRIITPKGTINTDTDGIVLMFNNDNDLSAIISMLVKTPVRLSGVRILTMLPDNVELTPLQISVLSILEGLDGIGGNDNDSICDGAIDGLKGVLSNGS